MKALDASFHQRRPPLWGKYRAGLAAVIGLMAVSPPAAAFEPDLEKAIAVLAPYAGQAQPKQGQPGVDPSGLEGKVLCGYQGWFTCPGDGSGRGWSHYGRGGKFSPGRAAIDLWPDVSELSDAERFATDFRHADGSAAQVFSSHQRQTVMRHFEWMQTYGIDGVFVQRFVVETRHPPNLFHCNTVLTHCREAANRSGRAYALMYDLSGMGSGQIQTAIDDWKLLVDKMQLGRDPQDRAYLHYQGKPLVAVWGIGFGDRRHYTLDECTSLVRFLKHDPRYGGNAVLLGVPSGWRTLDADSVADAALHAIVGQADIISPWTVGRYDSPESARRHASKRWLPDGQWCRDHQLAYLPVVFPGFSWHNLRPSSPLNQIPRRNGSFLWTQLVEAQRAGARMAYVAMFDEMDEGTAIFKCSNSPPTGASEFLDNEGLPSDFYLRLTGAGGKLLRGELPPSDNLPPLPP